MELAAVIGIEQAIFDCGDLVPRFNRDAAPPEGSGLASASHVKVAVHGVVLVGAPVRPGLHVPASQSGGVDAERQRWVVVQQPAATCGWRSPRWLPGRDGCRESQPRPAVPGDLECPGARTGGPPWVRTTPGGPRRQPWSHGAWREWRSRERPWAGRRRRDTRMKGTVHRGQRRCAATCRWAATDAGIGSVGRRADDPDGEL